MSEEKEKEDRSRRFMWEDGDFTIVPPEADPKKASSEVKPAERTEDGQDEDKGSDRK